MRTIKLVMAYDGAAYHGWQWQADQPSVQAVVERAIQRVTGESSRATASSRTDAGVHALGQVVSFRTTSPIPSQAFVRALNANLPVDIAVLSATEVDGQFHAIRSTRRKRYRYVLFDGPVRDVFQRGRCWHSYQRLDAERMQRAAQAWVGKHDFRSFESQWPQRQSSVRTVLAAEVERGRGERSDFLHFEIEADGFLYNMVRAMVGTLVDIGRGARPESWAAEVLAAGDRRQAGMTAPAHGLYLLRVWCDDD